MADHFDGWALALPPGSSVDFFVSTFAQTRKGCVEKVRTYLLPAQPRSVGRSDTAVYRQLLREGYRVTKVKLVAVE